MLVLCLALLLAASAAAAQSGQYEVPWWRVAAGGGSSGRGDGWQVVGTIGQTEAGALLEGATYALRGGFWYSAQPVYRTYLPTILSDYAP